MITKLEISPLPFSNEEESIRISLVLQPEPGEWSKFYTIRLIPHSLPNCTKLHTTLGGRKYFELACNYSKEELESGHILAAWYQERSDFQDEWFSLNQSK